MNIVETMRRTYTSLSARLKACTYWVLLSILGFFLDRLKAFSKFESKLKKYISKWTFRDLIHVYLKKKLRSTIKKNKINISQLKSGTNQKWIPEAPRAFEPWWWWWWWRHSLTNFLNFTAMIFVMRKKNRAFRYKTEARHNTDTETGRLHLHSCTWTCNSLHILINVGSFSMRFFYAIFAALSAVRRWWITRKTIRFATTVIAQLNRNKFCTWPISVYITIVFRNCYVYVLLRWFFFIGVQIETYRAFKYRLTVYKMTDCCAWENYVRMPI